MGYCLMTANGNVKSRWFHRLYTDATQLLLYIFIYVLNCASLSLVCSSRPLPQMSYHGPGSIYSIGLNNMAWACLLLSIGSFISMMAFWGRIQGKLGSLEDSLAVTLFKVRSPQVAIFSPVYQGVRRHYVPYCRGEHNITSTEVLFFVH